MPFDLHNTFEVAAPPDQTFAVLLDVPRVVPCFPGAELLEAIDAQSYRCKVTVRLGPISLTFRAVATIVESDAAAKHATLTLRGSDEKGRGGTDAVVRFQLTPAGEGTHVDVATTVNLTGMVAQYGRGAGIIQALASEQTRQFATHLATLLQ
jgi:carbon monoxide dehydrogenase subunit G